MSYLVARAPALKSCGLVEWSRSISWAASRVILPEEALYPCGVPNPRVSCQARVLVGRGRSGWTFRSRLMWESKPSGSSDVTYTCGRKSRGWLRAYKVLESQSNNNNLTQAESQRDENHATFMEKLCGRKEGGTAKNKDHATFMWILCGKTVRKLFIACLAL